MPNPIDFYFDFSSPYSYLASEQIEAVAARHGRTVRFKPILLGIVFKTSGGEPLTESYGPKATYSVRDFERSARFAGVRFQPPSKFPIGAVAASRAVLWLEHHQPDRVNDFVHAVFRAFFQDDRDISDPAVVERIAAELGLDAPRVIDGAQQPEAKDELRRRVEEAIAFGVFGAPTIVVDGEVFWGNDRLPQIERWLATGPF